MAKAVITEAYLEDIADAIRAKLNTEDTYKPPDMADAISSIVGGTINLETKTKSYTPTESIQTETITAASGYNGLQEVDVTVGAVSSTYVGSEIPRKASVNLTVSGATVTAPAGYYSSDATKTISSGTEGTPTATKGSVSNHAISVTPSVTNVGGYISGGTHSGTAVSVAASELVSGNLPIAENGTGINVTNYATVSVAVPSDKFIVNIVWDNSFGESGGWVPDCTWAEIAAAYAAEKEITFQTEEPYEGCVVDGWLEDESPYFMYLIFFFGEYETGQVYDFSSEGVSLVDEMVFPTPEGTINITQSGTTDVSLYQYASVPSAANVADEVHSSYITQSGQRKWQTQIGITFTAGWLNAGTQYGDYSVYNAIPTGTTITPSSSAQTIGGADYMMEGAVTVNAIPSDYIGSSIPRYSSSDASVSGNTVTFPSGYYAAQHSASVSSGTEGTPTATKGTVSNHAISVTPSVTNVAGYISGGTHTGTAVSVSASEVTSGNKEITSNGTNIDVVNYATVSVAVPIPTYTDGDELEWGTAE